MADSGPTTVDESARNVIGILRGSRPMRWLLLDGSRFAVSAVFLLVMAGGVLAALLVLSPTVPYDRLSWLFNGLVNGLLSLVTIVLTINQLNLSRQFGSPKDLNGRLTDRIDFREELEERTGTVISPTQPAGFMAVLFGALYGRAQELSHYAGRHGDRLDEALEEFTDTVVEESSQAKDELEDAPFEMASLLTILNYDDSWQFYASRRLEEIYGDDLHGEEEELVGEIREILKGIDTARQYFKTVYLQRELAQFSRSIVYTGVLALVTASVTLLAYREGIRSPFGVLTTVFLVTLLFAFTLTPVAVLFAYVLRLATVARRTVVFGPFTPQEEQEKDSDWNL